MFSPNFLPPSNPSQITVQTNDSVYNYQRFPETVQNPKHSMDFLKTSSYELPIETDTRHQLPALNHLHSKRSSKHFRSLLATFIFIIGQTLALVIAFLESDLYVGANIFGSLFFSIGGYVIYLFLVFGRNQLLNDLNIVDRKLKLQNQYNTARALNGNIYMTAQCYHSDSNSDIRMSTHVAYQKITPSRTEDISGELDWTKLQRTKSILLVKFQQRYRLKDIQNKCKLDLIYQNFQMQHKKDDYQEYCCKYLLPQFNYKQGFLLGKVSCSFKSWFYLFTALGLAWPYSLWVEHHIDRFTIPVTKVVTI